MNTFQYGNKGNIQMALKLILCIVLILITVYLGNESLKYLYKIRNLEAGLEKKNYKSDNLYNTLKDKEKELELFNSDWGKEEYLRKTYKVAMPGEKVIIIVESTSTNDFEIIKDEKGDGNYWSEFYYKFEYYLKRYINL